MYSHTCIFLHFWRTESVKPCKGIFKTDGALKKMKDMLQSSRQDIPRIAIVMADASNYASHSLEKQAKAIHKDGVTIIGVGKLIYIGST